MKTYCGIDCCKDCDKLSECGGCNGANPVIILYKRR